MITDFIYDYSEGTYRGYMVRDRVIDDYTSAWSAALGMWQASRYGLPSDNSNLSDTQTLHEIGQDIQSILLIKEMGDNARGATAIGRVKYIQEV